MSAEQAFPVQMKFMHSLPPGKDLSVSLSIVRPLKIESAGAIFLLRRSDVWKERLAAENFSAIRF
ncbi:hypothetical protein BRYFOR_07282 [Marvinbryantia formatexigens DSM 14469]|uniref:Uncharacterized protein n=1 Tax=Marvinbryantia formatexigens DSM 14469 TaxID=478749 RepID=C6LF80_9FIRM|nr:hypothetical protein BRYFOR_07282 [Marvinbryantia formatexigens DSM 14469]